MENIQYKFLKTLCDLFDGEHFVPETEIRAAWPECPPHNAIFNLGNDVYFEFDYNLSSPGYLPTPLGRALVEENKEAISEGVLRIATAAEKQAKIAEHEAAEAKADARKALRHSRISNIIAGVVALITLLSWLFPSDVISVFLKTIFPHA